MYLYHSIIQSSCKRSIYNFGRDSLHTNWSDPFRGLCLATELITALPAHLTWLYHNDSNRGTKFRIFSRIISKYVWPLLPDWSLEISPREWDSITTFFQPRCLAHIKANLAVSYSTVSVDQSTYNLLVPISSVHPCSFWASRPPNYVQHQPPSWVSIWIDFDLAGRWRIPIIKRKIVWFNKWGKDYVHMTGNLLAFAKNCEVALPISDFHVPWSACSSTPNKPTPYMKSHLAWPTHVNHMKW